MDFARYMLFGGLMGLCILGLGRCWLALLHRLLLLVSQFLLPLGLRPLRLKFFVLLTNLRCPLLLLCLVLPALYILLASLFLLFLGLRPLRLEFFVLLTNLCSLLLLCLALPVLLHLLLACLFGLLELLLLLLLCSMRLIRCGTFCCSLAAGCGRSGWVVKLRTSVGQRPLLFRLLLRRVGPGLCFTRMKQGVWQVRLICWQ